MWINYAGYEICSLDVASKLLLLSKKTLYNLISAGKIKAIKIGKRNFIEKSEIKRFQMTKISGSIGKYQELLGKME